MSFQGFGKSDAEIEDGVNALLQFNFEQFKTLMAGSEGAAEMMQATSIYISNMP